MKQPNIIITYSAVVKAVYHMVVDGDNNRVSYFYDTIDEMIAYLKLVKAAGYTITLDISKLSTEDKQEIKSKL